jgi:P4 family phage/plasmid primase-like protien
VTDNVASITDAKKRKAATASTFDRGDHVELASALLRQLDADSTVPVVFSDGALWRYDASGVWVEVDEAEQSVALQKFAGSTVGTGKRARKLSLKRHDISGAIKLAHDRRAQPDFFIDATQAIAFTNGVAVVSAAGIDLREPHPDQRVRVRYPFSYDAKASCPRFESFLVEIFEGDTDAAAKRGFLQEFLGACLLGAATRYGKILVATGEGSNGKSVFCAIAEAAMPAGTTSSIAPQLWSNEYRRARLVGKRLNIVSELPESDIIDSEAFKAIVTGDRIDARPIREAPFEFRPIAGHLCAANRLPGTTDQTLGFWRRIGVLEFGRVFAPHEQDAALAQTIISAETPGVVRWAFEGAQRLLGVGQYTQPDSSLRAVAAWRRNADQVSLFVTECTTPLPVEAARHGGTPARQLYKAYVIWCSENGHRPVASNKFGERMKLLGKRSEHADVGNFYPVKLEVYGFGGGEG